MRLARQGRRWSLLGADGTAYDITDLLDPSASETTSWQAWCTRLADGLDLTGVSSRVASPLDLSTVDAPVVAPSKIIGLLGNDVDRGDASQPAAASIDLFVKASSSIVGPSQPVRLPSARLVGSTEFRVVPECELAVVVGRGGSEIPPTRALTHVLGYTVALDLTLRGGGERSRRKSLPTFCPVGPLLVSADEVTDPDDLAVRLSVGDELIQDWSTAKMARPVADAIAWVSDWMPLEPGDLLLLGAPTVTWSLAAGDVLRAEIEQVGELSMTVVA
jgi:2-keto-4-pentenoate hydratase/2-oxohepta-3-ene-1,7-dioic acid hydratase in catechol pathway